MLDKLKGSFVIAVNHFLEGGSPQGMTARWIVVVAFVTFASLVSAVIFPGCDGTRAAVFECIQQLLDLNHNGEITAAEASVALSRMTYLPSNLNWEFVMLCDMDEDGVLTIADWNENPSNRTCLPTPNCLNIACDTCVRNGFTQSKRAPAPAPPPLDEKILALAKQAEEAQRAKRLELRIQLEARDKAKNTPPA